jgi:hypothetical protein
MCEGFQEWIFLAVVPDREVVGILEKSELL